MKKSLIVLLVAFVGTGYAKKVQSDRIEAFSPEASLREFVLPDGFVIELVASEEDGIVNPIDLTFDDAGRLWTQTASMYPLDPVPDISWNQIIGLIENPESIDEIDEFKRVKDLYEGRVKGDDKILVIEDPYAESPTSPIVWADGLAIPQSILPRKNGAYVAQGSEMLFLEDTNGDGKADRRNRLLTGFGFVDSHTMAHTLVRGPGGWVHFSHGALNAGLVRSLVSGETTEVKYSKILRMALDGGRLELLNSGLNNIWGFQQRANGQWYGTEANDMGYSVTPLEGGSGFGGIGRDRLRPYQPWVPQLHEFRVGGTGISGLAFSEDSGRGFPDEWKDVAFLANPITSSINCVRIVRHADGTVEAEHLPDLLNTGDSWFRPVNIEFGPDGCLYIADWYNKIISHNEVNRAHPDRDKKHGRIWRIRHISQSPRRIPNFYEVETSKLVAHLSSPFLWEKRAAWHQIEDRAAKDLVPDLLRLAQDEKADTISRIHALWSLEGFGGERKNLLSHLIKDSDADIRREAIRSLTSFSMSADVLAKLLTGCENEMNAMVRSQTLRTIGSLVDWNNELVNTVVAYCGPELPGSGMGGPYERSFERYLARVALEAHAGDLIRYMDTNVAKRQPVQTLLWAVQSLPREQRHKQMLALWNRLLEESLDDSAVFSILSNLENEELFARSKLLFASEGYASMLARVALANNAELDADSVRELLIAPVRYLLERENPSEILLGLSSIANYRLSDMGEFVSEKINSEKYGNEIISEALKAYMICSDIEQERLSYVVKNEDLPLVLRSEALLLYSGTVGSELSLKAAKAFADTIAGNGKEELARSLSNSPNGAELALDLYQEGILDVSDFDVSISERLARMLDWDERAKEIFKAVKLEQKREAKEFETTLNRYMQIAERNSGVPSLGKPLFDALCLSCHVLGDQIGGFAPALDGSAYRDDEGLLTAILNPDAAVESAYVVFRIIKKDGGIVEGYRESKNQNGITLRFMGGGTLFVPSDEIEESYYLSKRSVMPKGLISGLNEEQVSDILAYIKTLK